MPYKNQIKEIYLNSINFHDDQQNCIPSTQSTMQLFCFFPDSSDFLFFHFFFLSSIARLVFLFSSFTPTLSPFYFFICLSLSLILIFLSFHFFLSDLFLLVFPSFYGHSLFVSGNNSIFISLIVSCFFVPLLHFFILHIFLLFVVVFSSFSSLLLF